MIHISKILTFSLFFFIFLGCKDRTESLHAADNNFRNNPSLKNAKKFIAVDCDGGDLYLRNALLAKSMVEHPDIFKDVLKTASEREKNVFLLIDKYREKCFEYYPELEPENFILLYEDYYSDSFKK